jgi:hypothetical protein
MIRVMWALVLMTTWTLGTGSASAEPASTVGVVVVEGEGSDAGEAVARVIEELRAAGLAVQKATHCEARDDSCLRTWLQNKGIPMGAYVSVWDRSPTRELAVVAIGLVDPSMPAPFDQVFAERSCEALPCPQGVREAVQEVLAGWPERRGTQVALVGAPTGAGVVDNGELLGRLPLSVRLPRGEHVMRVVAEGYEPKKLALLSGGAQPQRFEVRLAKKEGAESPGTRRVRKPWMVAVGSVLAVAGATMIGVGASRFGDRCTSASPCTEYTTSTPAAGALVGVGAVTLGGGVGLLVSGLRKETRP